MSERSIARAELVDIVDRASVGCAESTRVKLREVAQTTDAVAVGWFHCDGVRCPASQANRRNQRFQTAYDCEMAQRFNWDLSIDPFVVRVEGAGSGG